MTRWRGLVGITLAAAALAGLQATTPNYATLRGAITRDVADGALGQGQGFAARLAGLTTAQTVTTQTLAQPLTRTTDGIWLIVKLRLEATGDKPMGALPVWHGASGRRYDPSRRVSGARLLPGAMAEPGAGPRDVYAIFEVPQTEIAGGFLTLRGNMVPSFDAQLRFAPSNDMRTHRPDFDINSGEL